MQVRDSARHAFEGPAKEPPSLHEILTGKPEQATSSPAPEPAMRDPRAMLKAMGMKTKEPPPSAPDQLSRPPVRGGGAAPLGARR